MFGIWYSMGSSTVMILWTPSSTSSKALAKVVDLPDPVGPVTSTMPLLARSQPRNISRWSGSMPRLSSAMSPRSWASSRSTMDSPNAQGTVETRMSMSLPAMRREMRPSWGRRRSAMSIPATSLMRDATAGKRSIGCVRRVCSTPSMRMRTAKLSSAGSTWMSEASKSTAWESRLFTSSMIGASSAISRSSLAFSPENRSAMARSLRT